MRSLKSVRCPVRLCCLFRAWYPMLYFTVYQAAFLSFRRPSWSVCSLACIQSQWRLFRFHERSNFEGRMLTQLFTIDSLYRSFIQALSRRLHPGGTSAVKWILVTLVKPDSIYKEI